tara:strand:+ start:4479 stop:5558 length:1080 start_codon:yes stop_codon:yes gene_type:complete
MFKIYERYIIKKYFKLFFIISLVFLSLAIILNIFEEISFFKDIDVNPLMPYFLTFLNAPITLFEIFPFIFLISAQFFFYEIFKNDEIVLLKSNGLSNFKIIKILFFSSLVSGIIIIALFYNLSSKLKFLYTDIKNNYTNDNKFLAVVNDTGLWLKDETSQSILIIKSNNINDNLLINVLINEFDLNFNLKRTLQSKKVDISNKEWKLYNPIITYKNISTKENQEIKFKTNFDNEKIKNLFSNFSTLDLFELFILKKDYENLGYSSDEIKIHIFKIFLSPYFFALMTILSSILMINIRKNKSIYFNAILGIFTSVMIYYLNFVFISLGNTGRIPPSIAVFLPMVFITIFSAIGLVRINEK